ncbi:MAG: ABC transporter ATP-binding protein, partial [Planctomycetota bacterium]
MSSFGRALRLALRRRVNVVACVLASLMVALLWAANLAPVLLVVDVVMQDRSVPEWIDEQIAELDEQLAGDAGRLEPSLATRLWLLRSAKPAADTWLPDSAFETLVVVCLFLLVGTLVKNVFRIAGMLLAARVSALAALDLRDRFYRKVLRLDLADFGDAGRGDLMTRCTGDLANVGQGIQTLFGPMVREPLKMVACTALAAMISWRLLLLTVVVAPVVAVAIHYLSKSLKRANRRAMEELSTIYETLAETLAGIRVIKAYTSEAAERDRFAKSNHTLYRRQMRIAWYDSLVSPVTENLGVGMVVIAVVAGGYLVLNEQTDLFGVPISSLPLTHGEMAAFFASLVGMSDPARRLSGLFNQLQRASASAERVYAVLDREPSIVSPPRPIALPAPVRGIEFDNVHFRYQPDKPVLEGVDFDVRPGETIAIVGPNG